MAAPAPDLGTHLSSILGEAGDVLQEILPGEPPVALVSYPPSEERSFWTLVTSGMSAQDMNVPGGLPAPRRVELVMSLTPDDMNRVRNLSEDTTGLAIVNLMRWLARFPSRAETFFDRGHSVPMPDEFDLGELAQYIGVLLAEPLTWPRDKITAPSDNGTVGFLAVYPLFGEESAVAKQDPGRLFQMMWGRGQTEVLNLNRDSLLATPKAPAAAAEPPKKKKRLFGLLK